GAGGWSPGRRGRRRVRRRATPGRVTAAQPAGGRGGPGAVHPPHRGRGLRGGPPPVHRGVGECPPGAGRRPPAREQRQRSLTQITLVIASTQRALLRGPPGGFARGLVTSLALLTPGN